MRRSLHNKVIIVTGGGSGIGRAAADLFAREGARIVIADRDAESGREAAEEIAGSGGMAEFITTDVADERDVAALVDAVDRRYGRLDGAFNNAGIAQSHRPLHEIDGDAWSRVINVNLSGTFYCMKYELALMLRGGKGAIVNTSSVWGAVGAPAAGEYAASKHGVIGLTRAAALDYAKANIRVNAILPGLVMTPILSAAMKNPTYAAGLQALIARIPRGRGAQPDEVVEGARWLLSDQASYVTGAAFSIDGGFTAA